MRTELSKKSKRHMERNRYLELKYFCFQYPIWKKAHAGLLGLSSKPDILVKMTDVADPVAKCVEAREFYSKRIALIEECCKLAAPTFWELLLKGVTEGLSYDILAARNTLPVSRAEYYISYRSFFWIMNTKRA